MNKKLIFVIIFIVLVNSVYAVNLQEQREIAKKVAKKYNYKGSLSFVDARIKVEDLPSYYSIVENATIVYATYTSKSEAKKDIIHFYSDSKNLSKYQFKCLILHELGHYYDYRKHYIGKGKENDADTYMIQWDKYCENWQNMNYQYLEFKI